MLAEKVDQILREGRESLETLGAQHRHAAWHLLKQSIWPRFNYWAANCYPSQTIPASVNLDKGLHSLLEFVTGLTIPQGESPDSITVTTNIPGRREASFAAWVRRQPVKCGGLGLRSYVGVCRPAFIGACELAIPQLHRGFCPTLVEHVGGSDSFGEVCEGRWSTFLNSGCRAGKEFGESWRLLQYETECAMEFLGEDEEEEVLGPIKNEVESAGGDSTSGGTRGLLTQAKEKLMGRVLLKALEDHPNQEDRAVFSWPERDKLSAQFLLQLPGHNTSLTAAEFSECVAALMCLPSPACCDPSVLGTKVGKRRVDKFGDNVMSQTLPGDGYRKRHDAVKDKIGSLLKWAAIPSEVEVFNIFSGLILQAGLNRLERGRKRQGMVPDFRLRAAGVEGPGREAVSLLAELKVISCCVTRYSRAPRDEDKAVNRRAALLPGDWRIPPEGQKTGHQVWRGC